MSPILSGLVPIAAAIGLGWAARRSGLMRAEFWPGVNKLAYLVLLPALLYATIARAGFSGMGTGTFLAAATVAFLAMALIAVALKPLLRASGPDFTSVFQGAVRWNGFVILALAQASLSAEQAALVAIVFAPTVPLINVLCVAALSVWGANEGQVSAGRVGFRIVTNPLIVGCALGALASVVPVLRAPLLLETAELVGRGALPLILLTIGAGLDFSAIGAKPRLLAVAVALKLIVAPAVFIAIGHMFAAPREVIVVLAAIGAAPGAASSYVLAKELGGNAELTAGHVTVTTVLTFLSLPLWIPLAGA
ncbi:AEC family transporter [Parvularcula lutaonensis]|uniref:AEC family transporter n=1 Tax=Parvularcula lutaonensis TaxID=491923 RepID=A0ABV7MFZ6_9PROT|nr:AEC family transporter [Parvularcula lutaonensis]GGY55403.1 transporter [Parvularcula lutaonensis]